MIVRQITTTLAAICAIAAAAGVAVIAAAFALYALLQTYLGPAGAAAVVAGTAALVLVLVGLLAVLRSRPRIPSGKEGGLAGRAFDMAKDKPMIAAGVAIAATLAAVVIAARNPKLVTAALTAFLAGRATPKG